MASELNRASELSTVPELIRVLERLGRPRIGVVGDLMLDQYTWGEVERISPEAPIPVLRVTRRDTRVGGAGSVAVNLAKLEAQVRVFSMVGDDATGKQVRDLLHSESCQVDAILSEPGRPTTLKTRNMGFVQQSHRAVQQILRVDEEDTSPVDEATVDRLLDAVRAVASEIDVLLVSDYKKGLISRRLIAGLVDLPGSIPVFVDPARIDDYSIYDGVDLICPNRFEAELASGRPCDTLEACEDAARYLIAAHGIATVAVTLDREGIWLARDDAPSTHMPTKARVVADVTGAGDMVLTLLGLVTAAGGGLDRAVELANVAAGIEVRHFGVTPIPRSELLDELRFEGHPVVAKVKSLDELQSAVEVERAAGRQIVFTNGCFDLLHYGHHHLLNTAKLEGDVLIVAVNSDASIRRLKGPQRPRIEERERVKMLAGMEAVDYVILFGEDTPDHLLEELRPHVLVKGSEYRANDGVVGREIVEGYGGRIAFVEQLPGISTTALLEEEAKGG